MIRFLNQETKNIASAATIVAAFAFLSRIAGFIRDRILAGRFGAGDTLDAYYAAFLVPDFLFSLLVVGALSASFIPLFIKHYQGNKKSAWDFTNNVLNIAAVSIAIISVVLFILTPQIAELIAPKFSQSKLDLVITFTRIMFVSDFLLALSAVFGSALQGMKRFLVYSLAPVLYNLGIIIGATVLVPAMGPAGLAWGVVLGAGLHMLSQLIAISSAGYRYSWRWKLNDADTREMGKLMVPRTMGVAVNQLNNVAMIMIATTLVAGSVTMYQFAYNIQFFVIGIVAVSFAVAAFPSLSEAAARKDVDGFVDTFSTTARQILFFVIPASVLFLLLRAQIVRVVVGAGKFGWEETITTADTLAFFTLSLFAQSLVFLLARGFYAWRDTATPFVVGLLTTFFNVIAALLFAKEFGVVGLGLSFSLSALVNVSVLWMALRLRVGSLKEGEILKSLFIISIAAMAGGIVTQLLKPVAASIFHLETFLGILAQGLVAGGAGLIVYGMIAWALKSPEMIAFIASMERRLFKRFEPSESISKDQTVA
ncbi:MAG: murein biosynthesis integral membrane protein MurJ [Patescibacteria group bacterium]